MSKKKRIALITSLSTIGVLLIALIVGIGVYLGTYYHADKEAVDAFLQESNIEKVEIDKRTTAFVPENPKAGFIFYPGGKVEVDAYYPLMAECAKYDILSIAIEMPFNLAVFDINAAEGIREKYPEVEKWYIGGHSLGGSMAASYLGKHVNDFDGLILLGSYSTVDFSDTSLKVLSIYGEFDEVMNRKKYDKYRSNLPNPIEYKIEGGNHAGFGMYGKQRGDGEATISSTEQIKETVEQISLFIK